MKKDIIHLSLRIIIIWLSLFAVIAASAAVFFTYTVNKTIINDHQNKTNQQITLIDQTLKIYYASIENDIRMFAENPSIIETGDNLTKYFATNTITKMTPSKNGGTEQAIYETFKQYAQTHPGTLYIYLADKYGGYIAWPETSIAAHYDPRLRPWYRLAEQNLGTIQHTDPYIDLVNGKIIISNVLSVVDSRGNFLGVTGIDISTDKLSALLGETKPQDNSYFMLVHKTGLILGDPRHPENNLKNITDLPIKGLDTILANPNTRLTVKINGEDYIIISKQSQNSDWIIVSLVSKNDLFKSSRQLRDTLAMASICILAALAIIIGGGSMLFFRNRYLSRAIDAKTSELINKDQEKETIEQALLHSEEKYRNLVDNIPGMVFRCKCAIPWETMQMSKACEELTGYPPEFFTDNPDAWTILIHEDNIEKVVTDLDVFLNDKVNGNKYELEYKIKKKDGSIRWLLEHGRIIRDANREPIYLDSMNFDITDKINAQIALQEAHDLLELRVEQRTNELHEAMQHLVENEKFAFMGSLVAGIAHEVNTPLGVSVITSSHLLKINEDYRKLLGEGKLTKENLQTFTEDLQESLAIMAHNLDRTATLIASFKQLAVDQNFEEQTTFNLNEYLHIILLSLKPNYDNNRFKFEIICPSKLEITSCPGIISQIMTNLIMNSIVHGFKNRPEGRSTIKAWVEGSRLNIEYSDNGNGIPQEDLDKIFLPFFTTNRQQGGSGLGLYVIHNLIVHKLNGEITCKSELGKGTVFSISFPLANYTQTA